MKIIALSLLVVVNFAAHAADRSAENDARELRLQEQRRDFLMRAHNLDDKQRAATIQRLGGLDAPAWTATACLSLSRAAVEQSAKLQILCGDAE